MQKLKKINFSKIEKKWQKRWQESKAFEPSVNPNKEKFFFTTPYPYISGSLHIGQGRAATESDIYCRYKRMSGLNVLFPMSFHITGTPVLSISIAIKNKNKEKIKLYGSFVSAYEKNQEKVKKIVRSFEDPQKIVDFFIPKMIEEYSQLGLSIDWTRSFTSGSFEHQALVTWQFHKYKEKNYLIKGKYPTLYSPKDESAMGEDDIVDADIIPVEKQELTILKFKFKDKFLVAATLRPETIFGQTNLWLNPEVQYEEAEVGNEIWLLSKEAIEKLEYQRKDIKKLGKTKEKLLGEYAIAPGINKKIIILPSKFVSPDIGTGIVTSVPSDAPYDYVALKEIQESKELEKEYGFRLEKIKEIEEIEIIPIIKTQKYGDKAAVNAVESSQITSSSDSRLDALTQEVYKEGFHAGIMNENCSIYAGMKVSEAKEKVKSNLISSNQAATMFETSRKAVSRSGGKIIVAVLDDQWFLDFNAKGWKEKAFYALDKVELVPNLKKQFEDNFAWLDKRPCTRKRGLGTPLPFNKEWLIESLSDSTIYMALYTISHLIKKYSIPKEALSYEFFEYVFLNNGNLKELSEKIKVKEDIIKEIKQSFEYWMPNDHRHTFVLHLSNHLSFMLFAHAAIFPEKYWPKKISFHGLVVSNGIKMSKSKGNQITLLYAKQKYGADIFRFYMTSSSNIEGVFDWREQEAQNAKKTIEKLYSQIEESIKNRKKGKVPPLLESKFNNIIKSATEKISQMKLREYNSLVVFDMFNLVKEAKITLSKEELKAFYNMISETWLKLISPVTPHIAEELWEKLGKNSFVSLESWPKADKAKISPELEEQESSIKKLVEDIKNIMNIIKLKQKKEPEKVYVYAIPKDLEVYNLKYLEKKLNKKIIIYAVNDKNKYDPENKAQKAKPGKPAIYLE